jgi:rSAM/selenodomain-associated transferase 1
MMDRLDNNCVFIFVKYPAIGEVKTRLATELGTGVATELYRNFILDTLYTLKLLKIFFRICYYPSFAEGKLVEWLGKQYSYMPQLGVDLGERMKNAFLDGFDENLGRIVVIGSDSPDLPADFIREAFIALESHDVVVGPSSDGGYYLIGFSKNRFLHEAFENIGWGGKSVFEQTVDILRKCRRSLYLLPQWYDVDTAADLNDLVARNRDTVFNKSKTFACALEKVGTITQ